MEERQPVHSPQEIGAMLLGFYRFLTTLHYDVADLKEPPPEGWPGFASHRRHVRIFRSKFAIQVMRYLPYLNSAANLHYKCKLLDYTTFKHEHFSSRHQDKDHEDWWSTKGKVPASWMLPLAAGGGNGGSVFFLNTVDGEINEIILSSSTPGPIPLKMWTDEMQNAYNCLHLIPCPGRVTMDCRDVPEREERDGRITEDQFREQTEDWPTELDVQYVRQVYRDYGWPHAFRRNEATAYLCDLLVSIEDENDNRYWEEMNSYDDPRQWA